MAGGIGGIDDFTELSSAFHDAAGRLLDSHGAGEAGGTGKTFDWDAFPADMDRPLILAGGLNPENIAAAIAAVRPYAVDLSSGVESAPGIKEKVKIQTLMNEVKRVDCER
jgi:phosphoribosylanthranilate isomerase